MANPIEDTLFWMDDDISRQNYLLVKKIIKKNGPVEWSDGLAKGLAFFFKYI